MWRDDCARALGVAVCIATMIMSIGIGMAHRRIEQVEGRVGVLEDKESRVIRIPLAGESVPPLSETFPTLRKVLELLQESEQRCVLLPDFEDLEYRVRGLERLSSSADDGTP